VSEAPARPALERLQKGDRIAPFPVTITSEDVRAYLDATGEAPATWERAVPPLALGAFALAGLMERVAVPAGIVHTGQEYDFVRPVRHGETLEVAIAVASRSERRGAVITAFESEWRAGGEVVGTARTTVLVAPPGAAPA
jgi:acyl dehydratase